VKLASTKPEQTVMALRQIEVEIANGKPQACRDAQITGCG
jgi:hypothetical protein